MTSTAVFCTHTADVTAPENTTGQVTVEFITNVSLEALPIIVLPVVVKSTNVSTLEFTVAFQLESTDTILTPASVVTLLSLANTTFLMYVAIILY